MGGFLQWLMSNGQVFLILLPFIFGVMAKVFRVAAEQRAKRAAAIARERAELERLRTGGRVSVETQPQEAARQLSAREEMEARAALRRAQIEEMRRQRGQGRVPGGPSTPGRIPGGPPPVPSQAGQGRGSASRPVMNQPSAGRGTDAQPVRDARAERTARDRERAMQVRREREQQTREAMAQEQRERQRMEAARQEAQRQAKERERARQAIERGLREENMGDSAPRQSAAGNATLAAAQAVRNAGMSGGRGTRTAAAAAAIIDTETYVPQGASEWRRAILMNEILGKPVSLRHEG